MASLTLSARWLFPGDRPPLAHGTVTIADGLIVAIEPAGIRRVDIDLGAAALVPGLVNAHTHLDLSDAVGRIPPTPDFTEWIRQVIAHRRQQTPEQLHHAIAAGLAESVRHGVTALGDISAQGASWEPLAAANIDAVVYFEVIGLSDERAAASLERVQAWLQSRSIQPNLQPGISPHAPYTVGSCLLKELVALQSKAHSANHPPIPFAIHLGETRDELELLAHHTGAFVEFLKSVGVYDEAAFTRNFQAWLQCSSQPFTLIHGNYLDPAAIAAGNVRAVVYCPRTHAAFGHEPYPLRELLRQNLPVALGTDSLASNPDLNILAEARLVREKFPDIDGATILAMLTRHGATALGDDFARRLGTLTPGKDATFTVLTLPNHEASDPHDLLWEGSVSAVRTMLRGLWREPTAATLQAGLFA